MSARQIPWMRTSEAPRGKPRGIFAEPCDLSGEALAKTEARNAILSCHSSFGATEDPPCGSPLRRLALAKRSGEARRSSGYGGREPQGFLAKQGKNFRTGVVFYLALGLPALVMASSGEWLPYVSDGGTTGGEFNVFAVNLNSGIKTQLTDNAAIDNHPNISPNGQWVVWSSTRGNGEFDLYLGDFTNLEATAHRLTDDSYTNGPQTRYPDRHCHFRSDNRTIIFTSKNRPLDSPITVVSECCVPKIIDPPRFYEGLNVIVLDDSGTNVAAYHELDIRDAWDSATYPDIWVTNSGTYAGHPGFSPDGSNIVFSGSVDGDGKVWEVYTVGYDAGATNLVPNSLRRRTFGPAVGRNPIQLSGGAHFSHDGSNILFSSTRTSGGNSQIFSIPAGATDVPVTSATQRTSHPGNDYVPEPLSNGSFIVVTDFGMVINGLRGPGLGPTADPDLGPTVDLDLVNVSPDGTRTDLVAEPNSDEMLLIADEVSWFCGLSPNLSASTYVPRTFSIESLYLEKSAWLYTNSYVTNTLIPTDLLAGFGYSDKAVYMYAKGWENMEAVMSQKNPSRWAQILACLQLMHADFATFPGLGNAAALRAWMLSTDSNRNLKVVVPSVMYDRGIGARWVATWKNPLDGYFTDPANWDFGIPGSNDVARFSSNLIDTVVVRITNQVDRVELGEIQIEMIQLELKSTAPIVVYGPVTVGGGTGDTSLAVSNLDLSADKITLTNNTQVWMVDSFFDVFTEISVDGGAEFIVGTGSVVSASQAQIAGELRGSGEIRAQAQITGRVSPDDDLSDISTLSFKSNVVFQSGAFACHAATDTSLDKIIADGAVSGTGTVVMTAADGAAPAYQVIIDGSDASDYSGFSVTPAADWRLVRLAGGKLAVTKSGAGRADPAMVDNAGNWYIWSSGAGYQMGGPYNLGVAGTPVAADFDGDGKADPAMVDSAAWYVWLSGAGYQMGGPYNLGVAGTPVAADFDGAGRADPAMVDNAGNWYIWSSGAGYQMGGPYNLGVAGTPVAADFDGDGKADPAMVDNAGNWYIWSSGAGYQMGGPYNLGVAGTPVAADFDGDGKADPAMVDSAAWYVWLSGAGYQMGGPYNLGVAGTPVAADFDGR